jgi:type I restriction enzyme S subunit
MASKWYEFRLGELGTFKNGANFNKNDYGDDYPIVSVKNLFRGRFVTTNELDALKKGVISKIDEYLIEEGDIVFARSSIKRSGAGQIAIVGNIPENIIFSGFTIRFRLLDKTKVNPFFLLYLFKSPIYRELFTRIATGTTISNLSQQVLSNIKVRLPNKTEQDFIVKQVNDLDTKAELCNQTNQTLEQVAQAIFKSWFIDFDPVIDNALAAGTNVRDFPEVLQHRVEHRKQAQQRADYEPLPYHILNLFPSGFEQCDEPLIGFGGWIPKGWESNSMNEIVDIASSKRVFAKDYVESGVPFFRGKEISELSQGRKINTEIFISEEKYQELEEKSGAPKQGDILITSVGTIGNTYLVKENDKFYFKDGNLTWINGYKKGFIPFYMKEWFKSVKAKNAIERIKIGTTQQAITIKGLSGLKILCPEFKLVQVFEKHAASIFDKHDANIEQIDSLNKLRDTLLPKLISGELVLTDSELSTEA